MAATLITDDATYLNWLIDHPQGWVANVAADGNPSYLVVHRATCGLIRPGSQRTNAPGAATQNTYRKVVGVSEVDVVAWGIANGRDPAKMRACQVCQKGRGVVFGDGVLRTEDVAPRPRRYWGLLANPHAYDVERAIDQFGLDPWPVPNGDVRVGDRGVVWRTLGKDKRRGVVAFFEVLTDPQVFIRANDNDELWHVERPRNAARRVWVRYVKPSTLPLWLNEHPEVLGRLSVAKGQGTQIYKLLAEQWERVVALAGGWPETEAMEPEVVDPSVERRTGLGQGRQQSPEVRRAVERHAMGVATELYRSEGWDVSDESARQPFDLFCTRSGERRYVEVKGTTGGGASVIVTRGEVEHVRQNPTECAIVVVAGIQVDRSDPAHPICAGGDVKRIEPWLPQGYDLDSFQYEWRVNDTYLMPSVSVVPPVRPIRGTPAELSDAEWATVEAFLGVPIADRDVSVQRTTS